MSYVRLSRRPLLFGSFTGLEITEFDIISKEIESEYYEHERKRLSVYFDGTNTTNRILKVLEEEKLEIVLLDELDKLPRNFAEKLLNFLESGRVKVDQKKCQMDFELKGCKVFATANEINRLSKPVKVQKALLTQIYRRAILRCFRESTYEYYPTGKSAQISSH